MRGIALAIKKWYCRNFRIITTEQAVKLHLKPWRNVYGDRINQENCRSVWVDEKHRGYRVEELAKELY
jgi:hypothetical protein